MKIWGLLLLPVGLLFAPVANADVDTQSYLGQLGDLGIEYRSVESVIHAGFMNCKSIGEGHSYYETVYWAGMGADLSMYQADNIVATAIDHLCPEYRGVIPNP